ncbi:hypothetical protein BDP55DRAFT_635763 [Colletotrichum godetiae]|uniref:Uncharacterized protein n=1 Tax=Colletotrichum godetiae TaxID=1209918 RepID=A0AAJ0EPB7_9PEZI|nr:uncharacterized protein BDP55DRAFT_635763 [Colletotrichum godetiae]KAK1671511.1 hypothetical protein BDP55DRAFT_635763 [Colletotrichum godetiae]
MAAAAIVCEPVRAQKEVAVSVCDGSASSLWCPRLVLLNGLFLSLAAGIDWVEGFEAQVMDDGMKSARSRRVSPIREENNKRVRSRPIKRATSHDCAHDWLLCPHPMKLGHPNSCAHQEPSRKGNHG